jgi:hypothetical protein
MKKPATVLIIVFLALIGGIAVLVKPSFISQSSPKQRTFKEPGDDLDEFVGKVKSCTVETEEHEFTTHFMDFANRYKRKLFKTTQFDREGKKVEEFHYRNDDVPLPKTTYTYDKKGVLFKENHYSAVSGKPYLETIYVYDEQGRLKEEFGKDIEENTVFSRTLYSYELGQNYLEITDYDSNNVMRGKIGVKLNSQGRMSEAVSLSPRNKTLGKASVKYDEKGNMTEMVFSPSDGSPMKREKYTYEFDTHGNWIKKTLYHWVTEDGKSIDKLMNITHRIITYY